MDRVRPSHLRWVLGQLRIETVFARSDGREEPCGRQGEERGEEGR